MRVVLGIEYDGNKYHGWQRQPVMATVQNSLEQALSSVADQPIVVQAAGRTDTGVHATGQVVHFDCDAQRSHKAWVYGTNSNLPKDISVRWARFVSEDFHARFSAKARRYIYIIYNNAIRPSLLRSHVSWNYRSLDHKSMAHAAEYFIGEHDFTSFRAIDCQSKSPMREVHHFRVARQGDLVILDVAANAFLHHMVRNMAGVLMSVGTGRRSVEWIQEVLAAKDRSAGCETAPPYGLYLAQVCYPDDPGIPQEFIKPMIFQ